ncbi:MAG: aminotransferase class IV [Mariprofundaceae bacterium]|nr:aminotransferase class IV [Mariprofundaceae bacterium]
MPNRSNAGLRALMYGECCFETFRCIDYDVFALEEHRQRLSKGLASFGLQLASHILPEAIAQAAKTADDCMVRVTVGGGVAAWGLSATPPAQPEYWIQTLPSPQTRQPIHLQQVQWPFPLLARQAKYTADYAMSLRALQMFKLEPHVSPLICDAQYAHSATTSNAAFFIHGQWLTPPADYLLSGVIRAFLLAKEVLKTSPISLDMLADVEAIALSNSGFFITAVASLNGRELCVDGEIFEQLWQPLLNQKGVKRSC